MDKKVLEFLKNRPVKLCVLATSSKELQPWAAVLGYAVKDDLTIILSTHPTSRKWHNLKENNKVALVFGWEFSGLNIQCEGVAELIEQGEEYKHFDEFFFGQNPHAAKFKTPDTVFLKINLKWMRVTDFNKQPPTVKEQSL